MLQARPHDVCEAHVSSKRKVFVSPMSESGSKCVRILGLFNWEAWHGWTRELLKFIVGLHIHHRLSDICPLNQAMLSQANSTWQLPGATDWPITGKTQLATTSFKTAAFCLWPTLSENPVYCFELVASSAYGIIVCFTGPYPEDRLTVVTFTLANWHPVVAFFLSGFCGWWWVRAFASLRLSSSWGFQDFTVSSQDKFDSKWSPCLFLMMSGHQHQFTFAVWMWVKMGTSCVPVKLLDTSIKTHLLKLHNSGNDISGTRNH